MTISPLHGIAEFRHRVTVCTAREFVIDQGIFVRRGEVFTAKAKIVEAKGSFFTGGYAVEEKRNAYSHKIFIRLAPRFDISGSAGFSRSGSRARTAGIKSSPFPIVARKAANGSFKPASRKRAMTARPRPRSPQIAR